jgi:hypothetical protein
MKLTSKDFGAMKMPAIALAIAVAASFAMVGFTSNQRTQSERQYRDQLTALQGARTRYQRSGEERETVMHYIQAYRQLEKIGFVGAEQRLNWVESLRLANAQAGLFGVDYQMTAQAPFPFVAKDNPVSERLKHSQMKLSFGVLHEADLMRLFNALSAQQPGLFALTGCSMDRAGRQGPPLPKQANLSAQCDLSWVTIDPGKGAQ